jgi:hypothetical protein
MDALCPADALVPISYLYRKSSVAVYSDLDRM